MDNIKSSTGYLVIVTPPSGEELIAHKSFDGSFTARSKKDINNFINLSTDWIERHTMIIIISKYLLENVSVKDI